mgnify:CR=1 FL=1
MTWHVEYTSAARKELRKMGRVNAARILDWMDKHIDGCEDPRVTGKGLTANRSGQWRSMPTARRGGHRRGLPYPPSQRSL